MFARVSTYEGSAEEYDRGLDKMRSDIVPLVRDMPGSKGVLMMVDHATGQSLSITLWENEDAMVSSRETANRIRSEAASSIGSNITKVTEYEVSVAELS